MTSTGGRLYYDQNDTCTCYFWVGTNSGMDYWNGTLDWTTGLSYFPFVDRFMCLFLEEA